MSDGKRIMLIAFHFPPYGGGSGVHRATGFARYLPENGWQPHVLTVSTRAYEKAGADDCENLPGVTVMRAPALDAQRHLSFRGRYFRWFALPDRWTTWVLTAVPKGLFALHRSKIQIILATFPIPTALLIGLTLNLLTGKPLIADFRDSMTEEEYPRDPTTRWVYRLIEKLLVRRSSLLLFTTPSTRRMYLNRYPDLSPEKCVVLANGYDEDDFSDLDRALIKNSESKVIDRPVRLVHAGVIYTDDRDPRDFFRALGRLKAEGVIDERSLMIDLIASGSENYYSELLHDYGIASIVSLLPARSHRDALMDIAHADGLLLFQAASCSHQIPAKVYEYFRTGKPILALTNASGDTAALLREVGGATVVELDNEASIYAAVPNFVRLVKDRMHPLPDLHTAQKYTRQSGASQLARYLDKLNASEVCERLADDGAAL